MNRRGALLGSLMAALVLAGCASGSKPKPTPLQPVVAQIAAQPLWTARIGEVRFPLAPAVSGSTVVLAGGEGMVVALDLGTGRELWSVRAPAPVSAGAGSDGRFASIVTRDNELLTYETGKLLWRQRLPARVSTPPLVAGERVFVLGVDRVVQAFDALDGRPLWKLQRPGEPLTLAQAGVLLPFKDTLLVGQGPRLAGVDPLRGQLRWETAIALPRGANEVERLADLVGPAMRAGDRVCVRAFQSALGCVDAERVALAWSKNVGGVAAVGGDAQLLAGADASDRISAWNAVTGESLWTSDRLMHRGLSGAAATGRAVVFGDAEGYLHFLSRTDGQPLLRLATDGSPVVGAPVRTGNTLLAVTRKGGVFAFRIE